MKLTRQKMGQIGAYIAGAAAFAAGAPGCIKNTAREDYMRIRSTVLEPSWVNPDSEKDAQAKSPLNLVQQTMQKTR